MRQILYVSRSVVQASETELLGILEKSRRNNGLDGITGLLWADGDRFAQVIEGDDRAIGEAMDRIRADPRHHEITILHDRIIAKRQFGDWSMELRREPAVADAHDVRMRRALNDTSDAIRNVFSQAWSGLSPPEAYFWNAAAMFSVTSSLTSGTARPRPKSLRRIVAVALNPTFSLPPAIAGALPAP